MHVKRLICGLLAAAVCFSACGCGSKAIGGEKTKVTAAAKKEDNKGKKTDSNVPDEPDVQALNEALDAIPEAADYTAELTAISEQTDAFLTAVQAGDINAICDMLEPSSVYYKFFDHNRQSEQLSEILKIDFGDMVWTHWDDTDMNNKNWLENAYSEHSPYTRSYVCAGVKELLFYDEYFLLNFSKGQSVNMLFKMQNDEDCYQWLRSTVDRMPLLKNNWSFKCTLPDEEGKVLFNIDDDFIFDYTQILTLDEVVDSKKANAYVTGMAEARGTIEDENATFDESPDLRLKFAEYIREKNFEAAWQLTKDLDEDGFFDDRPSYADLNEAQQSKVDKFIEEHAYAVVCDHSTQVYDASRRRHVFTQIYYDAIPDDNEIVISEWLADNHIKESGEAVYFDITEDSRLASALGGYFDIMTKLG
ncbi:hypothetical protein [Ruminococcus sp.]|uniref:hypothetical protein n=1 Tax=Ruminococcus sp. TaxID=41978 RepID=UPI0025F713EA|nr:hypothetical protein [Ruminococcus sp.]MBQ8965646.1 hypothetical protein [Ruminococcus sp.]